MYNPNSILIGLEIQGNLEPLPFYYRILENPGMMLDILDLVLFSSALCLKRGLRFLENVLKILARDSTFA